MKYKICSYILKDKRWGPAYLPPHGQGLVYSEPTEFGIYFSTKEEADNYVLLYLTKNGVKADEIENE